MLRDKTGGKEVANIDSKKASRQDNNHTSMTKKVEKQGCKQIPQTVMQTNNTNCNAKKTVLCYMTKTIQHFKGAQTLIWECHLWHLQQQTFTGGKYANQ